MPTARLLRQFRQQPFTPTNGQTVFTLLKPIAPGSGFLQLSVNGMAYTRGTDYTASGVTVTWLDAQFVLSTLDCVVVAYDHI